MKWTKKEKVSLTFTDNLRLIETRQVVYESDHGHLIYKHDDGYFIGRHWFHRLKDAKEFVERQV